MTDGIQTDCPVCDGEGIVESVEAPEASLDVKGYSKKTKRKIQSTLVNYLAVNGEPQHLTSKDVAGLFDSGGIHSSLVASHFKKPSHLPKLNIKKAGKQSGSTIYEISLSAGDLPERLQKTSEDGQSFAVAKDSDVFHEPTCGYAERKNTIQLEEEKARFLGYRPCQACLK